MTTLDEVSAIVDELIDIRDRLNKAIQRGNGEHRIKTALAMAEWAVSQQPVQPGDMVTIDPVKIDTLAEESGWYHFKDDMRGGPFQVTQVGYNLPHRFWYADVTISGYTFSIPMTWLLEP